MQFHPNKRKEDYSKQANKGKEIQKTWLQTEIKREDAQRKGGDSLYSIISVSIYGIVASSGKL